MAGAHARSRRAAGVGWWQPPKPRRAATGPAESVPRHRNPDRTGPPAKPDTAARRNRLRRRIRTAAGAGVAVTVVAPLAAFTVGYLLLPVPAPDAAVRHQPALAAFADGSELGRLVPAEGNRVPVPIERVPAHVRAAVLAAEDRTFYADPGFDVGGILRAAWNQLRGGTGGGSTITQKYVEQVLVGDRRTLWRTFTELVLVIKVSQQRSKDEILGDYLNASYFGRGAYGVQAASQAYFGKDVAELTPGQGALLAGLIRSPSRWDPAVDPERALQRWKVVLDGMVAEGWLDRGARQATLFPPTVPRRPPSTGIPADDRGHIITAITAELAELGIAEPDLRHGGLRITTTIDPVRQRQAVDAAHRTLAGQPADLRSAMVAIDPATGGVVAYYGGDNGRGPDYARVQRLAGSTFTPFVVLAGLLRTPPVETFDGPPTSAIRTAAGADCRRCDPTQALTRQVGPAAVAAAARAAGITSPLDDPNAGIALGNEEVSAFDLASAYATLAAGGVWRQPHLVESVLDADGQLRYRATPRGEQRFPEPVARNVTETMLKVAERDGLDLPENRPVAARIGTVQSRFGGQHNDAWMAGFTPGLSTSVWMGTDRNAPIRTRAGTPISGSTLPGNAWRAFMADALASQPVQQFTPFQPIGEAPASAPPDPSGTASASPGPSLPPGPPGRPPPGPGPTLTPPPNGPGRPEPSRPTRQRPTRTPPPGSTTAEPSGTGPSGTGPSGTGPTGPTRTTEPGAPDPESTAAEG